MSRQSRENRKGFSNNWNFYSTIICNYVSWRNIFCAQSGSYFLYAFGLCIIRRSGIDAYDCKSA